MTIRADRIVAECAERGCDKKFDDVHGAMNHWGNTGHNWILLEDKASNKPEIKDKTV